MPEAGRTGSAGVEDLDHQEAQEYEEGLWGAGGDGSDVVVGSAGAGLGGCDCSLPELPWPLSSPIRSSRNRLTSGSTSGLDSELFASWAGCDGACVVLCDGEGFVEAGLCQSQPMVCLV